LVIIGAGGGIAYGIVTIIKPILEATSLDKMVSGITDSNANSNADEVNDSIDPLGLEQSSESCNSSKEDCCKEPMKPSSLIAMLIGFTVFVPMFVQGLTLLELEFLSGIAGGLLGMYGKILGAVILVGGTYFGLSAIESTVEEFAGDNTKLIKFGILGYVALMALSNLGISGTMIDYPFQALVTAGAVAIGLGGAIAIGTSESVKEKVSGFIK